MVRYGLFNVTVNSPIVGTLQEYDDPNPALALKDIEGPAVVKYVEAVDGAEFSVNIKVDAGVKFEECNAMSFDLTADGHWIRAPLMQHGSASQGWKRVIEGHIHKNEGQSYVQKLRFGSLDVVDNAETASNDPPAPAMGILQLAVTRCQVTSRATRLKSRATKEATLDDVKTVSETTLKGQHMDLKATLDAAIPVKNATYYDTEPVGNEPILTVIFKYRTKKGLEHEGVIEREHSVDSPRTMADSLRTSSSPDQAGVDHKVKQEQHNDSQEARKIKQEERQGPGRKRKRSASNAGEGTGSGDIKDRGFLTEMIKKIRHDVEALNTDNTSTPRKLEKQKATLMRKIDTLKDEVLGDMSDEEDHIDALIKKRSSKKKQDIRNAMEISDDDD
jgi:hypothetical protein